MAEAPPLPTMPTGVATSRSRSSYIREPNVDYSNPEVAERVARMHEQRAADIRAGRVTRGSPSTSESGISSPEAGSVAIRGSARRVATPRSHPREPTGEEEGDEDGSEPSPAQGSGGRVQVRRGAYGGTHTRFPSS